MNISFNSFHVNKCLWLERSKIRQRKHPLATMLMAHLYNHSLDCNSDSWHPHTIQCLEYLPTFACFLVNVGKYTCPMGFKRDPVLWSGQRCLIGSIGRRLLTVRHQSWGFDILGGWTPWLGVCFIMSIHQGSSWIGMNRINKITGSKSIRNGFHLHNLAQFGVLVLGMISCISSIIFGHMKPC